MERLSAQLTGVDSLQIEKISLLYGKTAQSVNESHLNIVIRSVT